MLYNTCSSRKIGIRVSIRVGMISPELSMGRCIGNFVTPWYAAYVLKFQTYRWSVKTAEASSAKIATQSGRKVAHSSVLDTGACDPAPTSWKSSFRYCRLAATTAKNWCFFQTSRSMKSGARRTSVPTNNARRYSSFAVDVSSSIRTRQYRFATMSATKCIGYNLWWRWAIRLKCFYSSSSTWQTRIIKTMK